MESLRYYIAHNGGLRVMEHRSGSMQTIAEHFSGVTLEHVIGCAKKPEIVFAAVAFDGGYRSEDAGKSWSKIMDGDVRTFTVDANDERVVYMGLGPIRLLRSEDSGKTWEPLDSLLDLGDDVRKKWDVPARHRGVMSPHVRHVFIHPDDSSLLYVLLEHGGVVLSRDRGQSWYDRSSGIDYVDMHYIENFPGSKDRYYVSSARGFFRSDNGGEHWRRVETGMPWAYTELYSYSHEWHFMPGGRMVLCGGKGSPGVWSREHRAPLGHILLSDDGGEHWRVSTQGLEKENPWMPWVLVHHPTDANALFCGMGNGARGFSFDARITGKGGLYATHDRGDSWKPVMKDTPSVLTAWVAPH